MALAKRWMIPKARESSDGELSTVNGRRFLLGVLGVLGVAGMVLAASATFCGVRSTSRLLENVIAPRAGDSVRPGSW